jgi:hypothetical protein
MRPDSFYRHSGKAPIAGLLCLGVAGPAAALTLGWIYGYAILWIPWVYLAAVLPLVLGAGVGVVVAGAARVGKLRSLGLVAVAGLILGVAATYVQWVAWLTGAGAELGLGDVGMVGAGISAVAAEGAWSVFGWQPTGNSLYAIWGIEGLVIVAISAGMPAGMMMDWVFCENCDAWLKDKIEMAPFDPVRDEEALKARIERGDIEPLLAFERVDAARNDFARITLKSCAGCQRFRLASLHNVERSYDKEGKEDLSETEIFTHLRVDATAYDKLSKL